MEESEKPEGQSNVPPMEAPISVPPIAHTVIPAYQSPPSPPPARPATVGLWVALIAVFLLVGAVVIIGKVSQKTGVMANGREMSRAEVEQMESEIKDIAEDVQAGDPFSIDTKKPVTSRLAKKLQEVAIISQKLERDFARAAEKVDFDAMLASKEMGSVAGRKRSKATLDAYSTATEKYFNGSLKVLSGLRSWTVQEIGREPDGSADRLAETEALFKKHKELIRTAMDLVALTDKGKAQYDAKADQLNLETDREIDNYNQLLDKLGTVSEEIEQLQAAIIKKRQEKLDEGLERLK